MVARRVAVLEHTGNSIMSQEDVERIEHRIRRILKEDMRNVNGSSGGSFIVLMSERSDEMAAKLITQIQKDIQKECGYQLIAGVDSRTVSGGQLKAGYLRAIKAVSYTHLYPRRCRQRQYTGDADVRIFRPGPLFYRGRKIHHQ